jgi:hypothetical protein
VTIPTQAGTVMMVVVLLVARPTTPPPVFHPVVVAAAALTALAQTGKNPQLEVLKESAYSPLRTHLIP